MQVCCRTIIAFFTYVILGVKFGVNVSMHSSRSGQWLSFLHASTAKIVKNKKTEKIVLWPNLLDRAGGDGFPGGYFKTATTFPNNPLQSLRSGLNTTNRLCIRGMWIGYVRDTRWANNASRLWTGRPAEMFLALNNFELQCCQRLGSKSLFTPIIILLFLG